MEGLVDLVSYLVLWTGGYLAAPLVFMATLGVFRNLAGMGTGSIKKLSGKMREPGAKRRAWGRQPRQQEKERRATMRGARNWNAINTAKSRTVGRAKTAMRGGKESQWDQFSNAFYETNAKQQNPRTQAGHLIEQASKIETDAAATQVAQEISEHIADAIRSGEAKDQADARNIALDKVLSGITTKIDAGTARLP